MKRFTCQCDAGDSFRCYTSASIFFHCTIYVSSRSTLAPTSAENPSHCKEQPLLTIAVLTLQHPYPTHACRYIVTHAVLVLPDAAAALSAAVLLFTLRNSKRRGAQQLHSQLNQQWRYLWLPSGDLFCIGFLQQGRQFSSFVDLVYNLSRGIPADSR
jgi:hypothetical protein